MSQSATTLGEHNIVIQIQGDGNSVVPNLPHLELTLYGARRQVRQDGGVERAADLVSAYSRSIPLVGRQEVLGDLKAWLANGQAASIQVLVGTAGRGKTRLALELCQAARADGWRAGFLTAGEIKRFRGQQNVASWGWNGPTLVAVDYVASHAESLHDWLVELADNGALSDPKTGQERPLRILLLERQADPRGGWWVSAFGRGGGDAQAVGRLLERPEPLVLPPLDGVEARREILTEMLARAGRQERPPAPGADADFDRRLADVSWGGEPLFLMMAGLAAAESGLAEALALAPDALAFALAARERERIGRIAKAHGVDGSLADHMAALATLCQGLEREAALAAIASEKQALHYGEAGGAPPTVYGALREALARDGSGLEPILPDIIGEAFLLSVWDGGDGRDGLAPVVRAAEEDHGAVAATVIRTCQDFAIRGYEAPLKWLEGLGEKAGHDLPSLIDLVDALPTQTIVLRELAARLTQTILDLLPSDGAAAQEDGVLSQKALTLTNLSNRLKNLGQRDAALAAANQAVAIQRELATARPDAFDLDLARSLNNLSNRLGEVGDVEPALDAIAESVAIQRRLQHELSAARGHLVMLPSLALGLNNLSNRLGELGRLEESLEAIEEAVDLYRKANAAEPQSHRPELANTLNTLSTRLEDLGRGAEALAILEEAVAIQRDLAAARPDAFRADLALYLNNLANRLQDPGAALAAIEEAVAIRRNLAAQRPEVYRPTLAQSLNNLSNRLADFDRGEDALGAAEESVAIYRALATEQPDVFRSNLAQALGTLANRLGSCANHEAALIAVEESVALHRRLAAAQPDQYNPHLALVLNNLSAVNQNLARPEAALEASAQALRSLSAHFLKRPKAYRSWMEVMAQNYVKRCEACDQAPDHDLLAPIAQVLEEMQS